MNNPTSSTEKTQWRLLNLHQPKIISLDLDDDSVIMVLEGDDQRYVVNLEWIKILKALKRAKISGPLAMSNF